MLAIYMKMPQLFGADEYVEFGKCMQSFVRVTRGK